MCSPSIETKKETGRKKPVSICRNAVFRKLDFGCFILGAQAPGAEFEVFHFTVNHDAGGMDIGRPVAVGMALGMADVMTVKRGLAANIALQFPVSPSI
jgi:hypothetical protein